MEKVAEVLAGLREEEGRLSVELSGVRRAIAALEEVLGIGSAIGPAKVQVQVAPPVPERIAVAAQVQSTPASNAGTQEPEEALGPYAILSFYEAAAAYLAAAGEPRNAKEIAEALLAGGYATHAQNFTATVRTMLNRFVSVEPFGIQKSATDSRWFVRT
jgi:hypothetical protein